MARYVDFSDAELSSLLMQGDEAAFTEIYNRYWDKLFAVAFNRCGVEIEAEEIVQDVFLSLWNRRLVLRLSHSIATYLSVAVKYQVINTLSRKYRKEVHLESISSVDEGIESTELWFNARELRVQLDLAVKSLPEKCRLVFIMSREEGKGTKQIAQELNIAEKTVEAHLTKALKEIRNTLHVGLPMLLYLLKK